jgi:hypothetical protein
MNLYTLRRKLDRLEYEDGVIYDAYDGEPLTSKEAEAIIELAKMAIERYGVVCKIKGIDD